jgi:predicted O-linked N-acetylglucosamine transferase (SPINDLY family)
LGRLRAADLFLDTLPCNAHTTASDALWAGLPLLTCSGETFASRVAGSLLHALGLPELVTRSLAEYEALGLRLAHTPAELAALREKLSRNRATAPLFDTPRYVRNLEKAYQKMWDSYTAGGARRTIEV